MAKAEQADATPLQDGLTIPAKIQRRAERKARLPRAKAEIEARAHARFVAEQVDYAEKLARREALQAEGKTPRGRPPEPPSAVPGEKEKVNFTDQESRIMPTKDVFQQAYHAQAGVETTSRAIVGARVSQAPNDKQQLVPTLNAVKQHVIPATVLVDSGYFGAATVTRVERETPGLRILAALIGEPNGRTAAQLDKRDDPPEPAVDAPFAQRMRWRTATAPGRALYKLRQQTLEPVFGIIKEAMGFRRFSLHGYKKVSLEWNLVCLAYNVKRLHRRGAAPGGGRSCRGPAKPLASRTGARLASRNPAQTGAGSVAAWFQPLENPLPHFLARLFFRILGNSAKIHSSGCFLSPTGC
jgi:hypothetical protein